MNIKVHEYVTMKHIPLHISQNYNLFKKWEAGQLGSGIVGDFYKFLLK